MKIELIEINKKRRGYKNSWRYKITDNSHEIKFFVAESLPSPEDYEKYFNGWEEWDEGIIWGQEVGIGLALRHTPDEVALMHYFLYKADKLDSVNRENGIEYSIDFNGLKNSQEMDNLKEEMRIKREKLISEENLESIKDLFIEETLSNDNTGNNNEFNSVSNSKNLGKIFVIGSLFGIVILGNWFIFKKALVKKQLNADS